MKHGLLVLLFASTQAFAAQRVLSCEADEGDTSVEVLAAKNGALRVNVTTEVEGGGTITRSYAVIEQAGAYVGKGFAMTVNAANQGHIKANNIAVDEDITCK